MPDDLRIQIQTDVDRSGVAQTNFSSQLQELANSANSKNPIKIKIQIDSSGFLEGLKSELKNSKLENVGKSLGSNISSGMNDGFREAKNEFEEMSKTISDKAKSTKIKIPIDFGQEYSGEQLADVFSKISNDIQMQTGNLPKISIREIFTDDGGSEAIKASVQYVNKELGTTVRTFYDITNAENGTVHATQSFRDSIINTGSVLKEINVDFQRAFAEEKIKTLQARTEGLNVDFTKLSESSKNIMDVTSLENFNNEFKILEQQIRTMRSSIQGEVKLDPIASMQAKLTSMPQAIEIVQNRLQKFADVKGFDEINKKAQSLHLLLEEISRPGEDGLKKTVEEQIFSFEKLRATLVEVNADIKVLQSRKSVDIKPSFDSDLGIDISKQKGQAEVLVAKYSLLYDTMFKGNEGAKHSIESLVSKFEALKSNTSIDRQKELMVAFDYQVKTTTRDLDILYRPADTSGINKALNNIEIFTKNNTKAAKEYSDELENMRQRLSGDIVDVKSLREVNSQLSELKTRTEAAGIAGKSFGAGLSDIFKKFSEFYSAARIMMEITKLFKQMLQNVIDLDGAMTELKKVTDETDATYARFLDGAIERAKRLGSTVSDVVKASADFVKMG